MEYDTRDRQTLTWTVLTPVSQGRPTALKAWVGGVEYAPTFVSESTTANGQPITMLVEGQDQPAVLSRWALATVGPDAVAQTGDKLLAAGHLGTELAIGAGDATVWRTTDPIDVIRR